VPSAYLYTRAADTAASTNCALVNRPVICYQRSAVFRLVTIALLTIGARAVFGGVIFDGSLGKGGPAPFANSNYMIPASFGKQIGSNLFQSFSQFNLISSQSATFTGPSNIQNILSRVTGGSPSSIDGTISSQIQGANLFFLNPAGVIFGPNAQINVSGSFAVSTANYLKLADGGKFNTGLGGRDVLTSAPISAFGFLSSSVGSISINGSSLSVADRKSFSIIGGDVSVVNATVQASGGLISILSVKSAGEILVNAGEPASDVNLESFGSLGNIDVSNCFIVADGDGPGGIVIRGANFRFDCSLMSADVLGQANSRGIDIRLTGDLNVTDGSFIDTSALDAIGSTGNAGRINIQAARVFVSDSTITSSTAEFAIDTSATAQGNAGNIRIEAGSIVLSSFTDVDSSTFDVGNAGRIDLVAHNILLDHFSTVQADTNGGLGNGGLIRIETGKTGNLELRDGSQITSATFGIFGSVLSGAGGDIEIVANSILIDGRGSPFRSTGIDAGNLAGSPLGGRPGNISIETGSLQLLGFAVIDNSNGSEGVGGSISIAAKDILLDPAGAAFPVTTIQSANLGIGKGGDINIDTNTLTMFAGAVINASTLGSGGGGQIVIRAENILLDGANTAVGFHPGGILADTLHFFGPTDETAEIYILRQVACKSQTVI